jgi:hypothetical protein
VSDTPKRKALKPVVTYPREAVLTIEHVAAGLGVSVPIAEKADLPTVYVGARLKRYVWGQILDTLMERAA